MEFEEKFEVGEHYEARTFGYVVLANDGVNLRVRKDDGMEVDLTVEMQSRIRENMALFG